MSDPGQAITDDMLKGLENKLAKTYEQAYRDISKKVDKYFEQFEENDKIMRALLDAGEISKEQYQDWRFGQMMTGRRWKDMQGQIVKDYVAVDRDAVAAINDYKLDVYAENYNYAVYQVEHDAQIDTSFTLYNKDLVRELVEDDPYIMPMKDLDARKDAQYARQKIDSAIAQGIIQGEPISAISQRLMQTTQMMYNSAVRTARTATTSAQNKGRLDAYHSLAQRGVKLQKQWIATLDGRTRHSHRDVDGEIVNEDDEFSNHLMFPADPMGAPEEVYNCRCTMKAVIEGVNDKDEDWRKDANIQGMSYEEWKEEHSVSNIDYADDSERFTVGKIANDVSYQNVLNNRYNNGTSVAKKAYDKYVRNGGAIGSDTYKGTPHYSRITRKIYYDRSMDANDARGAGTTFFHEHGHLVYHSMRLSRKERKHFADLMKSDVLNYENNIMSINGIDREEARRLIALGMKANGAVSHSVQDLYDGVTKGEYHKFIRFKHKDVHYWENPFSVTSEGGAHMFEASFDNEKVAMMKEYFPSAWKEYNDLLAKKVK